ncbi:MAG: hypothetical protein WD740_00990 [Anaerolineales bacterium]
MQGAQSANALELALGARQHASHSRSLRVMVWVRLIAIALLVASIVMLWMELM